MTAIHIRAEMSAICIADRRLSYRCDRSERVRAWMCRWATPQS